MSTTELWEILVPTVRPDGRPIRTRCHRVWDERIRQIAGGLTVLSPVKGQWVSGSGEVVAERMIPVRIGCAPEQVEDVADFTARFYEQQAIFMYRVSDKVVVRHYEGGKPVAQSE